MAVAAPRLVPSDHARPERSVREPLRARRIDEVDAVRVARWGKVADDAIERIGRARLRHEPMDVVARGRDTRGITWPRRPIDGGAQQEVSARRREAVLRGNE